MGDFGDTNHGIAVCPFMHHDGLCERLRCNERARGLQRYEAPRDNSFVLKKYLSELYHLRQADLISCQFIRTFDDLSTEAPADGSNFFVLRGNCHYIDTTGGKGSLDCIGHEWPAIDNPQILAEYTFASAPGGYNDNIFHRTFIYD